MTKDDLTYYQSLPLDIKVAMTKTRIREFITTVGETNTYVSFSGGKDSTVLLHIARELYPNITAVFCDTGLEFPELKEHVHTFDNVVTLKPKKPFNVVLKENGYPVFTKAIAHNLRIAMNNTTGNVAKNMFGMCDTEVTTTRYNMTKYACLINNKNIDFKISDICCDIMKKNPAKKLHGNVITGEMTNESQQRLNVWLKHGCNHFDTAISKSTPLAFWNESDIFEYIYQNNIKIPSVYGNVSCKGCDGYKRTGCIFCAFGMHLEKGKTRYQLLHETHPQLYNYAIDKLGFGHVFDTLNAEMNDYIFKY